MILFEIRINSVIQLLLTLLLTSVRQNYALSFLVLNFVSYPAMAG